MIKNANIIRREVEDFNQVVSNYYTYLEKQLSEDLPYLTVAMEITEGKANIEINKTLSGRILNLLIPFTKVAKIELVLELHSHQLSNHISVDTDIYENEKCTDVLSNIIKKRCEDYLIDNYAPKYTFGLG